MVVRGVVCKKNIAHRRMTSKIEKPRLLILGGALEYQRVSNHLSSFDTLLQQVLIVKHFSQPLCFSFYLTAPNVLEQLRVFARTLFLFTFLVSY